MCDINYLWYSRGLWVLALYIFPGSYLSAPIWGYSGESPSPYIWPKPSPVPSRSLQNWPKPADKARIGTEHKVRQRRGKHRARAAVTTKSNAIYFLVTVKLIATAMARRYRYQRFGPGSYTEKIIHLRI